MRVITKEYFIGDDRGEICLYNTYSTDGYNPLLPLVVFVHGFFSDSRFLLPIRNYIARLGFSSLEIDFRHSFGKSYNGKDWQDKFISIKELTYSSELSDLIVFFRLLFAKKKYEILLHSVNDVLSVMTSFLFEFRLYRI